MANKVSYTFLALDKFTGVADRIRRSTRGVTTGFDLARRSIKAATASINSGLKSLARSSRATLSDLTSGFKGLVIAAGGFFGARELITAGSGFQDAMADLSAITGATGEDFAALQDRILKMARTAKLSQKEVADAVTLVASAKPDLLTNLPLLAQTTEQVLLLANAAGIELSDAAAYTAQSLNIFGEAADQSSRYVNVLAAGAKFGSSMIAETGEAVLLAGPAARAAGLSFEQLSAAIQTVALGGIKGSQAGTALNSILGKLQRKGIDFKKMGLEGAFTLLKKKMDTMTSSTEKSLLAADLFGEEHTKVGLALLANANKLGYFERVLEGTNTAQEQANIRLATFSAKWRGITTLISEYLIKAFLRLEPAISKTVERFGAWLEGLQEDTLNRFVDSVWLLGRAVIDTVAKIGPKLTESIGMFTAWVATLKEQDIAAIVETFAQFTTVLSAVADAGKIVASIFKAVGTAIGEAAAALSTFDFSRGTSVREAFSIGGKLFGVFDNEPEVAKMPPALTNVSVKGASRTDVNVNLRAPEGAVESIKRRDSGSAPGLNLGVNMQPAGAM